MGGTHPDEKPAIDVVRSLTAKPLPGISCGIANQQALRAGKRMVDVNLASAFPGDPKATEYERRRAVEILKLSQGFDTIVDLRNIIGYGQNTACIDWRDTPNTYGYWGELCEFTATPDTHHWPQP